MTSVRSDGAEVQAQAGDARGCKGGGGGGGGTGRGTGLVVGNDVRQRRIVVIFNPIALS